MAAKSTKIKPEVLPPTKKAAQFHSLRVYFQLHEWNNLNSEVLKPEDWGWKLENGKYVPTMTDEPPATSDILNVIRCNCKTSSKAHVNLPLNVLAIQVDWNALSYVGTVEEQNVSTLARLWQMMMMDIKNLNVTMKICSNVFLNYDDYPFSKLFNNVMIKWLRFLQFH